MIFYNYTIKKMAKSVSTWVTFIIAVLPIWSFTIASLIMKVENFSLAFIMISFFVIALPIIFVTYQSIKVFRDEIENNTILSLQTKPISRRSMIFQGLLAILTSLTLMLIFLVIVPGFVLAIKNSDMFLVSLSVFAGYLLILSIFAIIGLRLSLSFSGKSFVGITIGFFGVGFYILFILSFVIKTISSVDKNTTSLIGDIKERELSQNITFKPKGQNSFEVKGSSSQEINAIYEKVKNNNNVGAYDVIEWLNPTSHWMRMFGAINNSDAKVSEASFLAAMFSGKSFYVDNLKKDVGANNVTTITFDIKKKESFPVYYPFILWIAIGALLIPLSIFSIEKRNIS